MTNESLAQRIAERLPADTCGAIKFDPLTILMIVSALIQVWRLWQDCHKEGRSHSGIFGDIRSRNILSMIMVKRAVKRNAEGKLSNTQINAVVDAFFDEANASKEEEIVALAMAGV
jgi:hypothetical protein